MIEPVYFHPSQNPEGNKLVGDFVCGLVWGGDEMVGPHASMGVFEDGRIIAGTLYHNWYPKTGVIELTSGSTSKRWLTRRVIRSMFSLPFDGLHCQVVVLRVSEKNADMVRIARSFGFSEAFIPRLRGRDEGEFIFTYTDDQWRTSSFNRKH